MTDPDDDRPEKMLAYVLVLLAIIGLTTAAFVIVGSLLQVVTSS